MSVKMCVFLLCAMLLALRGSAVGSEGALLPAGLIVTSNEGIAPPAIQVGPHFRANTLVHVDPHDLSLSTFFVEETAYSIDTLSWSPDGTMLAVLEYLYDDELEEISQRWCIVTREGSRQNCLADVPVSDPGVAASGLYRVTWSSDTRYIYFLSDRYATPTSGMRCLIEADVFTGETQRVVYALPFEYEAPTISWTSDLDAVIIGSGNFRQYQGPIQLGNLVNSETVDIDTFLPASVELREVCPDFSPSGSFISLVGYDGEISAIEDERALFLVDRISGARITVIDSESGYGQIRGVLCPTWQAGDRAVFFMANTEQTDGLRALPLSIFKYSLETEQLELFFQHEILGYVPFDPHMMLSPDGEHVAFELVYSDYQSNVGIDRWQAIVVFPHGGFTEIRSEHESFWHPMWFPPVWE